MSVMYKTKDFKSAARAFGQVEPGDRVRITEEFVVKSVQDGILYYEKTPESTPVEATAWEYWPTDHVKQVQILEGRGI